MVTAISTIVAKSITMAAGVDSRSACARAQARRKADEAKCGQIFPQMPSPPTAELRGIVQAPVHETPHRVIACDRRERSS